MSNTSFHANYPPHSPLWLERGRELKAAFGEQQSFFTRPVKKSKNGTEASFTAANLLIKKMNIERSSTPQLMMFKWMVFNYFSTKEELQKLLSPKTTQRGVDVYDRVRSLFVEKKVPLEKLVAMNTDKRPP